MYLGAKSFSYEEILMVILGETQVVTSRLTEVSVLGKGTVGQLLSWTLHCLRVVGG